MLLSGEEFKAAWEQRHSSMDEDGRMGSIWASIIPGRRNASGQYVAAQVASEESDTSEEEEGGLLSALRESSEKVERGI